MDTLLGDDELITVLVCLDTLSLRRLRSVSRHTCGLVDGVLDRDRSLRVPPRDGAFADAVRRCDDWGAILLQPGTHVVTDEIFLDRPVCISGTHHSVVAGSAPAVLHIRARALLRGLTVCRTGHADGYPNVVVMVNETRVYATRCRVTCAGDDPIPSALRTLDEVHSPPLNSGPEGARMARSRRDAIRGSHPQIGLFVGPGATVHARECIFANCLGPCAKVYRGALCAESCTFALSACGAGVLMYRGRLHLHDNDVYGCSGDGIALWAVRDRAHIHDNRIHDNSGGAVVGRMRAAPPDMRRNVMVGNACDRWEQLP